MSPGEVDSCTNPSEVDCLIKYTYALHTVWTAHIQDIMCPYMHTRFHAWTPAGRTVKHTSRRQILSLCWEPISSCSAYSCKLIMMILNDEVRLKAPDVAPCSRASSSFLSYTQGLIPVSPVVQKSELLAQIEAVVCVAFIQTKYILMGWILFHNKCNIVELKIKSSMSQFYSLSTRFCCHTLNPIKQQLSTELPPPSAGVALRLLACWRFSGKPRNSHFSW